MNSPDKSLPAGDTQYSNRKGQTQCCPDYPIYIGNDGRGYISTVCETLWTCNMRGVASTIIWQDSSNVFFSGTAHSFHLLCSLCKFTDEALYASKRSAARQSRVTET